MIKISALLREQTASLRKKIKKYREAAGEIKTFLDKNPHEWGRFQSDFNQEINKIFRDIMDFEKERLEQGDEDSVYKLKRIFTNRLRKDFLHGEYIRWSLEKPYGYAGDFKIIDDIYKNEPKTVGFERLHDNYYQMSTICNAVRNRKEDFKKMIGDFIRKSKKPEIRVMDLASGPCRGVYELLSNHVLSKDVTFDCYDSNSNAITYARNLLSNNPKVRFYEQNAVRLALMKEIEEEISSRYDIISSTGLFDYLDYRVSVRLIGNLRKLLNPEGILAISDVRDKFSNPSIYYMEWVADWNLIYRTDDEFRSIFLDAGFSAGALSFKYEQQGVMQYIVATQPN